LAPILKLGCCELSDALPIVAVENWDFIHFYFDFVNHKDKSVVFLKRRFIAQKLLQVKFVIDSASILKRKPNLIKFFILNHGKGHIVISVLSCRNRLISKQKLLYLYVPIWLQILHFHQWLLPKLHFSQILRQTKFENL